MICQHPRRGVHVRLTAPERKRFLELISSINATKKTIQHYRRMYSRRPKAFYASVFGFKPRKGQSVRVLYSSFNIHFLFERNDLIAFWRKVGYGPGSGLYYNVGDRDIKIKQLRGLVSIGRKAATRVETLEIVRHESVHAFEDYVKKRRRHYSGSSYVNYQLKSEINAYLQNFRKTGNKVKYKVNQSSRRGLSLEVSETVDDYLKISATRERIGGLQMALLRSKTKKEKKALRRRLSSLKKTMESKKRRKARMISIHVKTMNQLKKAVDHVPLDVLRHIIYETRYDRLHKKIPAALKAYRSMLYEWSYHGSAIK